MARTVLEIYLSSTAADLKPYRDAVYARLARIEFIKCIRQEDFGAQNAEAVQYCRDKARAADLFVGIIGLRRGWEPRGDSAHRSITEMEYDSAKEAGRGRYLWVSPDNFAIPGNLRESDREHSRQLAFRKRLLSRGEHVVSQKGFASPESLASEISEQLLAHIVTGDLIKLLRPDVLPQSSNAIEEQTPAVAAAVERLAEDKDVDLLAFAKNPHGVDIADLESKLTARARAHEAAGTRENKAGAEYWRHIGALAFLHNTEKALAAYSNAVALDADDPESLRYLGELQYRLGDLSSAETTFETLRALGTHNNNPRVESMGLTRLSWIRQTTGDLDRAQELVEEALQLASSAGWTEGIARASSNLGVIHWARGDIDRAEAMLRHAIALEEQMGSNEGVATNYGNLGLIYGERAELDKADTMQRKALKLQEGLGSKEGMARAYGNLGVIHARRNDLAKAEDMQRRAFTLYQSLGSKEGMANVYANLASISLTRGDLNAADEIYHQALALNTELGSKEGMANTWWDLGILSDQKGDQKKTCDCWRTARDLWRDMGLTEKAANAERWMSIKRCSED